MVGNLSYKVCIMCFLKWPSFQMMKGERFLLHASTVEDCYTHIYLSVPF